jgi:hypothetical protein
MQNCKRHLSKDLTRGTRLVQPRSSTIGKRSVVPKQREPLEKHRSTKPSTSIALKNNNRSRVTSPLAGKSPGLMQQHEQAARRRPMHPKVIGFFSGSCSCLRLPWRLFARTSVLMLFATTSVTMPSTNRFHLPPKTRLKACRSRTKKRIQASTWNSSEP